MKQELEYLDSVPNQDKASHQMSKSLHFIGNLEIWSKKDLKNWNSISK